MDEIDKEIIGNSMKTNELLGFNIIIGILPIDKIIEQIKSNDEQVKMKYLKKVCAHNRIIVALNADKDKYLNYKRSTIGEMYVGIVMTVSD